MIDLFFIFFIQTLLWKFVWTMTRDFCLPNRKYYLYADIHCT